MRYSQNSPLVGQEALQKPNLKLGQNFLIVLTKIDNLEPNKFKGKIFRKYLGFIFIPPNKNRSYHYMMSVFCLALVRTANF